jgi:hypothetical protein
MLAREEGRPKKASWYVKVLPERREREAAILDEVLAKAAKGGVVVVPPLKSKVEEKLGKTICLATLYNLLHRHGFRKLAPDTRHPKGDEKAREDWKKTPRPTGRNRPELPREASAPCALPGRSSVRADQPGTSMWVQKTFAPSRQNHAHSPIPLRL